MPAPETRTEPAPYGDSSTTLTSSLASPLTSPAPASCLPPPAANAAAPAPAAAAPAAAAPEALGSFVVGSSTAPVVAALALGSLVVASSAVAVVVAVVLAGRRPRAPYTGTSRFTRRRVNASVSTSPRTNDRAINHQFTSFIAVLRSRVSRVVRRTLLPHWWA
ncbi:hypothetical protein FR943_05760 [Mycobacterium sp. TNTM28]|uniref:Uncharacterized protein n=1 Tax=[Mycobacterium] fortunisiensis TaxID=2600579 RepID=A0ABS6KIE3_9MYCO|nr:hypothetical protein [[Mycobacterium] fortunisiensis]